MKKLTFIFILLSSALVAGQSASAQSKKYADILKQFTYKDNIVYKTVGGQQLKMLVFLPAKPGPAKMPVMLFTHGGGWSGGDRYVILKNSFIQPLKNILDSGIACVSIEYRLSNGTNTVMDAVADCKDAGKFLVQHAADLGFDANRMGVWGGSAGGHLSLMTALADDAPFKGDPSLANIHPSYKCVVSYYPQTTFTNLEVLKGTDYFTADKLKKMFGDKDDQKARKLVSPIEYIRKSNPPALLLHGTADSTLSFKNSVYFISKAKKAGANARLIAVEKGNHGFSGKNFPGSLAELSKQASDFMVGKLTRK